MIANTSKKLITRVHNPSSQKFNQMRKEGKPFIIDGMSSNWKACKNWSNDYLINTCGNNQIPVETYPNDYFEGYKFAKVLDNSYYTNMTFREYMDIVEGKENNDCLYYLSQTNMRKYFPQLLEDITLVDFFKQEPRDIYLFFGFKNKGYTSSTPLHFDDVHNVFAQIRGRKRFLLFPPTNYLSFYPPRENDYSPTCSMVDPDRPDLELFPKFPLHEKIEVIINSGEILYLPPFWWHHVTALDENISLAFWYPISVKDFWLQRGILPTLLQFAPHVIPKIIRNHRSKRSLIPEYQ